jgi:hypothetical protein
MKVIYLSLLFTLISAFAHAQSQYLWAMATVGGSHGFGTLVRGNYDGTDFHSCFYSFCHSANGSYPLGTMAMTSKQEKYSSSPKLGGYQDSCVNLCL